MERKDKVYETVCWLKANEFVTRLVEEYRYEGLDEYVTFCNYLISKIPTIAEKIAFIGMVTVGAYQDDLRWGYSYYIPATRDVMAPENIRYARKVLRRKGYSKLKVKDLFVYPA